MRPLCGALITLMVLTGCLSSGSGGQASEPTAPPVPGIVATPASTGIPLGQEPTNHSVEPIGIAVTASYPGKFDIAFSAEEVAALIEFLKDLNVPTSPFPGSIEIIEALEDVDFTQSMVVTATTSGCVLDEFWLEPFATDIVHYSQFNEQFFCARANYFTGVFEVPLAGSSPDRRSYSYSPAATPRLSRGFDRHSTRTWATLSTLDWPDASTRFVFDETDRGDLVDELTDHGWAAGEEELKQLDLDEEFAVLLVVELCSPSRFWAEYIDLELALTIEESGAALRREGSLHRAVHRAPDLAGERR